MNLKRTALAALASAGLMVGLLAVGPAEATPKTPDCKVTYAGPTGLRIGDPVIYVGLNPTPVRFVVNTTCQGKIGWYLTVKTNPDWQYGSTMLTTAVGHGGTKFTGVTPDGTGPVNREYIPGTYQVWWNVFLDANGDNSDVGDTFLPQYNTKVALRQAPAFTGSATLKQAGRRVTFFGPHLQRADWANDTWVPLKNGSVRVQFKAKGSSAWKTLSASSSSDFVGEVRPVTFTTPGPGTARLVYDADGVAYSKSATIR